MDKVNWVYLNPTWKGIQVHMCKDIPICTSVLLPPLPIPMSYMKTTILDVMKEGCYLEDIICAISDHPVLWAMSIELIIDCINSLERDGYIEVHLPRIIQSNIWIITSTSTHKRKGKHRR